MKIYTKKKLLSVALSVLFSVMLFALAACECSPTDAPKAVFVFKNGDVVSTMDIMAVDFEGLTIFDVLTSDKYGDSIDADIDDTTYPGMPYLVSIFGIVPDPLAEYYEYISIYSTLTDYASEWGEPITIDGVIYHASGVGIAELPFISGERYLFTLESYVPA